MQERSRQVQHFHPEGSLLRMQIGGERMSLEYCEWAQGTLFHDVHLVQGQVLQNMSATYL